MERNEDVSKRAIVEIKNKAEQNKNAKRVVLSRQPGHTDIFWVENGFIWSMWQAIPQNSWWSYIWTTAEEDKVWHKYCLPLIDENNKLSPQAKINVISRHPDQFDIFWIANNGAIWTARWNASDKQWHSKSAITPAGLANPESEIIVVSNDADIIELFWMNFGSIWTTRWNEKELDAGWNILVDGEKLKAAPILRKNTIPSLTNLTVVTDKEEKEISIFWIEIDGIYCKRYKADNKWEYHESALSVYKTSVLTTPLISIATSQGMSLFWIENANSLCHANSSAINKFVWQKEFIAHIPIDLNPNLLAFATDSRIEVFWIDENGMLKNAWRKNEFSENNLSQKWEIERINSAIVMPGTMCGLITESGLLNIFHSDLEGQIWECQKKNEVWNTKIFQVENDNTVSMKDPAQIMIVENNEPYKEKIQGECVSKLSLEVFSRLEKNDETLSGLDLRDQLSAANASNLIKALNINQTITSFYMTNDVIEAMSKSDRNSLIKALENIPTLTSIHLGSPQSFPSIKCVLVGDGAAGKYYMGVRYTTGIYLNTTYMAIFDVLTKTEEDCELYMWFTAGQEEYDRLRPLSYPGTDIFLLCFSISSPSSYSNILHKWFPEVRHRYPNVPILLVGTKLDLRDDAETITRLASYGCAPISYEQGLEMAKKIKAIDYLECSSLTQEGLEEVFSAVRKIGINKHFEDIDSKQYKTRPKTLPKYFVKKSSKRNYERYNLAYQALLHGDFAAFKIFYTWFIKTKDFDNPWDLSYVFAIHWAAEKGNEEILVWLLKNNQISLFLKDENGKTPLELAQQAGHRKIVEILQKEMFKNQLPSHINDLRVSQKTFAKLNEEKEKISQQVLELEKKLSEQKQQQEKLSVDNQQLQKEFSDKLKALETKIDNSQKELDTRIASLNEDIKKINQEFIAFRESVMGQLNELIPDIKNEMHIDQEALKVQEKQLLELRQQTEDQITKLRSQEKLITDLNIDRADTKKELNEIQVGINELIIQKNILMEEHQLKVKKRKILAEIDKDIRTKTFYEVILNKLRSLLISYQATDGEGVERSGGSVADAADKIETVSNIILVAPIIGPTIDALIKLFVNKTLTYVDEKRQKNIADRFIKVATRCEYNKVIEKTAMHLVRWYLPQLQMLAKEIETTESFADARKIKNKKEKIKAMAKAIINIGKKKILLDFDVAPAEMLAQFIFGLIVDGLSELKIKEKETAEDPPPLWQQFIDSATLQKAPNAPSYEKLNKPKKLYQFFEMKKATVYKKISEQFGDNMVKTTDDDEIYLADIVNLSGIITVHGEVFALNGTNPQIAKYCFGTAKAAAERELEHDRGIEGALKNELINNTITPRTELLKLAQAWAVLFEEDIAVKPSEEVSDKTSNQKQFFVTEKNSKVQVFKDKLTLLLTSQHLDFSDFLKKFDLIIKIKNDEVQIELESVSDKPIFGKKEALIMIREAILHALPSIEKIGISETKLTVATKSEKQSNALEMFLERIFAKDQQVSNQNSRPRLFTV